MSVVPDAASDASGDPEPLAFAGKRPRRAQWVPGSPAAPRNDIDLPTLFAGLETAPALLLAVSGGPDSMALLHLAHRWLAHAGAGPALHVATVDHGLRPEASAEAQLVAESAGALGLPHATLVWCGAKPASRIQEKAREARYRLLAGHARTLGAPFVLTAHHADDQAETVLMRLGRGSGVAGLAAMRRSTPLADGIVLVRPLLGLTKGALLAICADEALAFARDPSNEDPTFARVRLRRRSEAAASLGLDRPALLRLARRMARAEEALAAETARVVTLVDPGRDDSRWRADLAPVRTAAPEIVQRMLAGAIRDVVGPAHLSLERLEGLVDDLRAALAARRRFHATLGGAMLTLDAAGTLTVTPEPPRRRGRARPD